VVTVRRLLWGALADRLQVLRIPRDVAAPDQTPTQARARSACARSSCAPQFSVSSFAWTVAGFLFRVRRAAGFLAAAFRGVVAGAGRGARARGFRGLARPSSSAVVSIGIDSISGSSISTGSFISIDSAGSVAIGVTSITSPGPAAGGALPPGPPARLRTVPPDLPRP